MTNGQLTAAENDLEQWVESWRELRGRWDDFDYKHGEVRLIRDRWPAAEGEPLFLMRPVEYGEVDDRPIRVHEAFGCLAFQRLPAAAIRYWALAHRRVARLAGNWVSDSWARELHAAQSAEDDAVTLCLQSAEHMLRSPVDLCEAGWHTPADEVGRAGLWAAILFEHAAATFGSEFDRIGPPWPGLECDEPSRVEHIPARIARVSRVAIDRLIEIASTACAAGSEPFVDSEKPPAGGAANEAPSPPEKGRPNVHPEEESTIPLEWRTDKMSLNELARIHKGRKTNASTYFGAQCRQEKFVFYGSGRLYHTDVHNFPREKWPQLVGDARAEQLAASLRTIEVR